MWSKLELTRFYVWTTCSEKRDERRILFQNDGSPIPAQCCIASVLHFTPTHMCVGGGGILLCFQILLRSLASNSCYSLVNIHFTTDKIFLHKVIEKLSINPLSAYPTKWLNTLKQFSGYIFTRYDLYQTFITYIANWKKIVCGSTRLLD